VSVNPRPAVCSLAALGTIDHPARPERPTNRTDPRRRVPNGACARSLGRGWRLGRTTPANPPKRSFAGRARTEDFLSEERRARPTRSPKAGQTREALRRSNQHADAGNQLLTS